MRVKVAGISVEQQSIGGRTGIIGFVSGKSERTPSSQEVAWESLSESEVSVDEWTDERTFLFLWRIPSSTGKAELKWISPTRVGEASVKIGPESIGFGLVLEMRIG